MAKTPVRLDDRGFRKFGTRDKLAYAAGDFGCCMSFALKSRLSIFWTQYMGIDSYVLSALLILVNVWDAINDPVIGSIIDADRRQYKRNKFLTYINIGSIGLIIGGAMFFAPLPMLPPLAKSVLFVAGYIIWDAFYTVANVPYGSLLSLITKDPVERSSLSLFRSVGSMVANMAAMVLVPMVIFDSANNLKGEALFVMAIIMGVIGFFFFQFMIRNTEVREAHDVQCNEDQPKFNVFKAMSNFLKNRAAIGATLVPVGQFIGMYGAATASEVMFQSYFKNAQYSGLIQLIAYLPMFLFMPFITKIVSKYGKKEACTAGALLSLVGYGLLVILPVTPDMTGIAIYLACQVVAGIGMGMYSCVGWALMADAMDYSEWKYGVREEGTTYALHSFFRKLAQGVGPSIGLVVATALGYNADLGANQPFAVAETMRYVTAGMYLFSGVLMFLGIAVIYNLDKKTLVKINEDLEARRSN